MLDGAFEQPADGLQPGVRVGCDVHSAGDGDIGRAVVVDEAPGADEGTLTLRQGPPHGHRAGSAQRHVAGGDDLDRGTSLLVTGWPGQSPGLADDLLGTGLNVAHGHSLAVFSLGGEGSPLPCGSLPYPTGQILDTSSKTSSASASVRPEKAERMISPFVSAASAQSFRPASVRATSTPR